MKLLRSVTTMLLGCLAMILFIATHSEAQTSRTATPSKSKSQPSDSRSVPEFKSVEEKEAWLQKQNNPNRQIIKSDDPTFPEYIKTGNPEADEANYQMRKAQWYESNQRIDEQTKSLKLREMQRQEIEAQIARDNAKVSPNIAPAPKAKLEDIIISDRALVENRQDGLYYMTVEDFRKLHADQQDQILTDHTQFRIVIHSSLIPKFIVSKAEFDKLPADKQQSMLNSNQYLIK